MNHPSIVWGAPVRRWARFSRTKTLVPGGASRVRLKSNAPFSWASMERCELIQDGWRRLRVKVACERSVPIGVTGKLGRSCWFQQQSGPCRFVWRIRRRWCNDNGVAQVGSRHLRCAWRFWDWQVTRCQASEIWVIGPGQWNGSLGQYRNVGVCVHCRILVVHKVWRCYHDFWRTIKHLLPRLEVKWKWPICSLEILPVTVMALVNTWLERTWSSMVGMWLERGDVSGINVGRTGFLERLFLRSCQRWPLVVESWSEICLQTSSDVSPVQLANYPVLIAFVYMLTTGLKAEMCRYWTMSSLAFME